MGIHQLILIAEHNDCDVLFYRRALEKAGFTKFLFLSDGGEVKKYFTGEGPFADRDKYPLPGMLVLDYTLPKATGADLLKWINDNPQHRIVPTIIFSANMQPEIVEDTYNLGVHTFFRKPNDPNELCELLIDAVKYWSHAARPRHHR
jgi:CheY-like chemotaxis protein